jgi:hypothetical protein
MAGRGREHEALVADLTRRGFLGRTGAVGLAAVVASAGPVAKAMMDAAPAWAAVSPTDAILQAFGDTIIPGRRVSKTALGNDIDPLAIAGVDDLPGAVEADTLALYHHPEIGFDPLAPPFIAALNAQALPHGGPFLNLGFDARVATCVDGLAFSNPARLLWEAAAAVPFTAFCAAALIRNATSDEAVGYRVMGLPGVAPVGYRDFSYRRVLSQERTQTGSLP